MGLKTEVKDWTEEEVKAFKAYWEKVVGGKVVDPLDRVWQLPQDWSNHVVYGGVLGLLVLCLLACVPTSVLDIYHADLWALLAVFLVAAAKKLFDYFAEHEPLWMVVGKTLATCVWPASIYLTGYLPN